MQLLEISAADKTIINTFLSRIDNMVQINDTAFINDIEMSGNISENIKNYMITVLFKGYKRLDNTISPIWRLKSIENV